MAIDASVTAIISSTRMRLGSELALSTRENEKDPLLAFSVATLEL